MPRGAAARRRRRATFAPALARSPSQLAEPLAVCGLRFTHASYDEGGDYLYLTKGVPLGPADGDTREGHPLFVDETDRVICVILNGARWHLARDGAIDVTLRAGGQTTRLARELVEQLLVETLRYS